MHGTGLTVFEDIFKEYCRPGGALRAFAVVDFLTKTAWIRSAWKKAQQEKGWEAPPWLRDIPELP